MSTVAAQTMAWKFAHTTIEEYLEEATSLITEAETLVDNLEPEPTTDDNEYYVVSQARYANRKRDIGLALLRARLALRSAEQKV